MSGKTLISLYLLAGVAGSFAGPSDVKSRYGKVEPPAAAEPKITYSKDTVAKAGEEVTLDCAVEGVDLKGVDGFGVSWAKIDLDKPTNSFPISAGEKILLFGTKYAIDHPKDSYKYSLVIKKLDEEDTGTYRCTVNFGADQKINAEIPVMIERAPYFTDNFTKTLTVTEGDAISIDCQPGGSPKPDVYWERVNDELPYYGGKFFKANQFDIPRIEKSHVGHYVCHADNGIGVPATSHVILAVQYKPDMKVTTEEVFAQVHGKAMLECQVMADPVADLTWYKEDEAILGSANMQVAKFEENEGLGLRSTLSFMQLSEDDFGIYTCTAENEIGKTVAAASVTMKSPPVITKQSRNEVLYDPEASSDRSRGPLFITLECEGEGGPKPEYRWTKNKLPIVWQADPRISLESGTGNLVIEDPTMEDNGRYQCLAYNGLGTALGDPVDLLNTTRVQFEKTDGEYNVEAVLGRPYKLSCPKAEGYPKPTYTWMKTYSSPEPGQVKLDYADNERTTSDPEGNLWFTHVTEEDDSYKNNFTYMCLAATTFSPADLSLGTTVNMKVVEPNETTHDNPELNIESFHMYSTPSDVNITAADENTLWCIYGGEPSPKVTWKRTDGQELDENRFVTRNFGRTLVMKDTVATDSGEYECQASNGVGELKSKQFKVNVDVAPKINKDMVSQTVLEGATVTFTCAVESTEDVKYQWYKNGRPLDSGNSQRKMVDDKLILTDVTLASIGNYACNATSRLGYAYGQTALNVIPAMVRVPGSSCEGMAALTIEVGTLKMVVNELKVMIEAQTKFIMNMKNMSGIPVPEPPRIISTQSGNEVLYNLEKSLDQNGEGIPVAVLECEADGGTMPEYRWTKNRIQIVWQADPRITLKPGTGNLVIERPTMEDNGRYQCMSINELGTSIADPLYLLNTTHIRFEATKASYDIEAELGRPFKLSCPKATGYPKPTITWMKSYSSVEPGQIGLDYADNDRITTDPEGTLWFTHITWEDDSAKNNFKFMCFASTSLSPMDLSLGTTVTMQVTHPADNDTNHDDNKTNIESILMYSSPSDVDMLAAEENTLWCIYGGEPSPKVTWKHTDGQDLDETRFVTRNHGRTLVMKNTVAADSGEYECQGANGVGVLKSKQFKVKVDVAPELMEDMVPQKVMQGETVTFSCATESTEDVKYQWYKNGLLLESGNSQRKMVDDKLILVDVSKASIGYYACNATSSLGYAYGESLLNVMR